MISRKPEFRLLYDDRAKEELDRRSELKDAISEGEARGEARGHFYGRISLLQQILGRQETERETLKEIPLEELRLLHAKLQREFDRRKQ